MSTAILAAAALIGAVVGFALIRAYPDKTETTTRWGLRLWRLLFVPLYAFAIYTIINTGGVLAIATAFIVTALAIVFWYVFRPDKTIQNFRTQ